MEFTERRNSKCSFVVVSNAWQFRQRDAGSIVGCTSVKIEQVDGPGLFTQCLHDKIRAGEIAASSCDSQYVRDICDCYGMDKIIDGSSRQALKKLIFYWAHCGTTLICLVEVGRVSRAVELQSGKSNYRFRCHKH